MQQPSDYLHDDNFTDETSSPPEDLQDENDAYTTRDRWDNWDECGDCNLADTIQSPANNGYLTFSYDALLAGSPVSFTEGDLHLMKLFLDCPKRLRGVSVIVVTPASPGTLVNGQNFLGLYSTNGRLLATTGDITSKLQTAGRLDALFTRPVRICGPFYVALLINRVGNPTPTPTLPPTFASIGGGPSAANNLFVTQANRCSDPRVGRIDGSFTSLPNTFNPQNIITPNSNYWVGIF